MQSEVAGRVWLLQLSSPATSSNGAASGLIDAMLSIVKGVLPLLVIVTTRSGDGEVPAITLPKSVESGDTEICVLLPLTLIVTVAAFDGMSKLSEKIPAEVGV